MARKDGILARSVKLVARMDKLACMEVARDTKGR